jgi:M6 family metalloprotease-like protein
MFRVKAISAAVVLVAVTLISSSVARAQGNSEAARLRQLNNQVLSLYGQLIAADASQSRSLRSQAAPVIAERLVALQSMIKTDPMAALQFAFDADLLESLRESFPGSASQFESQGSWTGPVEYLIFDDATLLNHRVDIKMKTGGETLMLHFKDHEPTWFKCNDILTVSGMKAGAEVAAANGNVSGQVASAGCSTTGVQNMAVLLVQFPGIALPAGVTTAEVNKIMFGDAATYSKSLNEFWKNASYGKASTTGSAFGPYTLDTVFTCNQYDAMLSAAIQKADADINFTQYTRIMVVFPNPGSCGWAGLAYLGCLNYSSADGNFTASSAWLVANWVTVSSDNGTMLAAHEGGHNLTLHHASSRYFTNAMGAAEPLGPYNNSNIGGTHSEYGDTHSAMGSWNLGHYAAPHKAQIGWLAPSNIQTVESNGAFTVQPFENVTSAVQALKVRRGTGNNAWLWLEFRQPIGAFDSTLNSQVRSGALIHHSDSSTGTYTHLVDFTPATGNNFGDPAKAAGSGTYVDPYTNLSFSVDTINGAAPTSALNVTVNYGAVPCAPANPTVTISPASQSGAAPSSLGYTVNVTNNDSAGCPASAFSLNNVVPSAWTGTFSNASPSIPPGSTSSSTLTVAIPASASGSNSITAIWSRGANSGSATATANVIVPPTTDLKPISGSFTGRATVNMSAAVTAGSNLVSGASVVFTMTKPGGAGTTTKTATTGSNGLATWNYRLGPKDPKGTYSVTARATASGLQGPISNTQNFVVQ